MCVRNGIHCNGIPFFFFIFGQDAFNLFTETKNSLALCAPNRFFGNCYFFYCISKTAMHWQQTNRSLFLRSLHRAKVFTRLATMAHGFYSISVSYGVSFHSCQPHHIRIDLAIPASIVCSTTIIFLFRFYGARSGWACTHATLPSIRSIRSI